MKKYTCQEWGGEFSESQLDSEAFADGEFYCKNCSDFLAQAGWDAVDPNHNFESFGDWDENGH